MCENKDINPLPVFLTSQKCVNCEKILNLESYFEIGFSLEGEHRNKLCIKYKCENCNAKGNLIFGYENYNLEKLCIFILSQSKFLKDSEKNYWIEYFQDQKEENLNNDNN